MKMAERGGADEMKQKDQKREEETKGKEGR